MTEPDETHEDIARRLRDTGLARAPDGLRADVMARVRAEPRRPPRRIVLPRLRPLVPYAAAACLLAGAVVGLSHLSGTGSSSSVGAAASGPEGGGAQHTPAVSAAPAGTYQDVSRQAVAGLVRQGADLYNAGVNGETLDRITPAALRTAAPHRIVLVVPAAQLDAFAARLRALEHTARRSGVVVILRAAG
jgi:hypothetical protein